MQRIVQFTKDGSPTVAIPEMEVTYHSRHGALQESMHVFIHAGLHHISEKISNQELGVLEMGFGTGLNALLALEFALETQTPIHYTTLEKFPIEPAIWSQLNYTHCQQASLPANIFGQLHEAPWETPARLHDLFTITKTSTSLVSLTPQQVQHPIQVIFFDAFAPSAQPELWTTDIFSKLFGMVEPGGILVTYCSKGDVRRAMEAAGWTVEKIPGPPGKREMVRAHRYSKL